MEINSDFSSRLNIVGKVADDIRMNIILQKYEPGSRLIELKLTEHYGVSRTTVRTALQILENEGIISFLSNGGKEVVGFSWQYASDLYDLREILECRAVECCIEGPLDYSPMLQVLSQIEHASLIKHVEDSAYFVELDMRYHFAIMKMSRNLPLLRSWETTVPLMRALLNLNSDEDYSERYILELPVKHRGILDMLIQQRYEAVDLMRQHIKDAREISLRHFMNH